MNVICTCIHMLIPSVCFTITDSYIPYLTHWGRVTQICVSKFTIIGSANGLSPIRRQAIIWTNAEILLIRILGTNFSEILIQIHTFSKKKMYLKMSSGKYRPFCLGLNVLTSDSIVTDGGSSRSRYEAWVTPNHNTGFCLYLRFAVQRLISIS